MRKSLLLLILLVLTLSIISTVFSILTATSPRWAVQKYYPGPAPADSTTFTSVICVAHRSPFYRCGLPRVGGDGVCRIPSCQFYPPSGNNRTSCRVDAEVGAAHLQDSNLKGLHGSYMECQEVHMAGNLQIAAAAFIGFGLLLSLAFVAVVLLSSRHRHDKGATGGENREAKNHVPSTSHHRRRGGWVLPFLAAMLVLSLTIGAILQVLAQFFGVLGLTLNASQTPDYNLQTAAPGFQNFGSSDWILDIALVRYASVAWLSALLCAVGTCWLFWRTRAGLSRG